MAGRSKLRTFTCAECGAVVERRVKADQRYCSYRCSGTASARRKPSALETRTCQVCRKSFQSPRSMPAKFCSRLCYKSQRLRACQRCGTEFRAWTKRQRWCSKRCRGLATRSPEASYIHHNGYRVIYIDAKPILQHRLVMEKIIGRPLLLTETVHHKDGDRLNNDPANLELWDKAQPAGQRVVDKIAWCVQFLIRHRAFIPDVGEAALLLPPSSPPTPA